ncbi:MAG: DUF4399 domain-containing protein [Gammaproteobacteria bacterium]
MTIRLATLLILATSALAAGLPRSSAPSGVQLYFIAPQDGATLSSPVTVRFGLSGMGVAPAGIAMESTGHHHLLIDTGPPPLDRPIPANAQHLHFGKGQTEAEIGLPPGRHRLQLLLGDHLHIPHDPPVLSAPITITVAP